MAGPILDVDPGRYRQAGEPATVAVRAYAERRPKTSVDAAAEALVRRGAVDASGAAASTACPPARGS